MPNRPTTNDFPSAVSGQLVSLSPAFRSVRNQELAQTGKNQLTWSNDLNVQAKSHLGP